MTLSLLLLLAFILFMIPVVAVSRNRIYLLIRSLLPSSFLIALILILDKIIFNIDISKYVGLASSSMFSFITNSLPELSAAESLHICAHLTYAFLYLTVFLITSFITRLTFIGTNPNIKEKHGLLKSISSRTLLFLIIYPFLFVFLAEIRRIIPFQDGLLKPLFDVIYSYGANAL